MLVRTACGELAAGFAGREAKPRRGGAWGTAFLVLMTLALGSARAADVSPPGVSPQPMAPVQAKPSMPAQIAPVKIPPTTTTKPPSTGLVPTVPLSPAKPTAANPQPEPPTRPLPGAAWPSPAPGGAREGNTPSREMLDELRNLPEGFCSRPANRPRIVFRASRGPAETFRGDPVTLNWQVQTEDGRRWPTAITLREGSLGPQRAVGATGNYLVPPAVISTSARTWILETHCGHASVEVGMAPEPVITSVSEVLCEGDPQLLLGPPPRIGVRWRPCPPREMRIAGRNFHAAASTAFKAAAVSLRGTTTAMTITSWNDNEIVMRPAADWPGPDAEYQLEVRRGDTDTHFQRVVAPVPFLRRVPIGETAIKAAVDLQLAGAEVLLDNVHVGDPVWRPRGNPLEHRVLHGPAYDERRPEPHVESATVEYCQSTHDEARCFLYHPVSRMDRSYIKFGTDGAHVPLGVVPQDLGIATAYVSDVHSRGALTSRCSIGRASGARCSITIPFESDGREIVVDGGPDVDVDGLVIVLDVALTLVPDEGRLTLVAQSEGTELRATIRAGGICSTPVDLCDGFFHYVERIRREVPAQIVASMNSASVQSSIRGNLGLFFGSLGIDRLRRVEAQDRQLWLEY